MNRIKKTITRWIASLLCAMVLFSANTALACAQETTPADQFFQNVGFLQFHYQPRGNYIYNSKYAFQWFLGFNSLYDDFAFAANCYIDTIRCKFRYDRRDWLIQFWKGSYGVALATGGEIGVYNKPAGLPVEHYYSAAEKDWLGMGFSLYRRERELFSRPFDKYWWCTGFQAGYLPGWHSKPRGNCTMVAKLQLKDAEMAQLLAGTLEAKGFAPMDAPPTRETPECYYREGDMVHLAWQTVTESWY